MVAPDLPNHLAKHIDVIGGVNDFPHGTMSSFEKNAYSTNFASDTAGPVILYMLPGDTTLGAFVLPICSNGKTTTNQQVSKILLFLKLRLFYNSLI